MWRKRLGATAQGHATEGRMLGQDNQTANSPHAHLANLLQAARAAKEYIDHRVDSVASQSRSDAEALSHAVEQVHIDQVVLKERLGAHLQSMEASALNHIDAVSNEQQKHHDDAIQALEDRIFDFMESSMRQHAETAESVCANENGIVVCQRSLNTRMDDLESSVRLAVNEVKVALDDDQSPVALRLSKIEGLVERIPERVLHLEDCVDSLPSRISKLECSVEGCSSRVSQLESKIEQVPNRVLELEERIENFRYGERRMIDRVDRLTAASQQAIATAVSQISGRIERVDHAFRKPLEDTKLSLAQMIEGVAASTVAMVHETEIRMRERTVPKDLFLEMTALVASLQEQVVSQGRELARISSTAASPSAEVVSQIEAQKRDIIHLRSAQDVQQEQLQVLRAAVDQHGRQIDAQTEEIARLQTTQATLHSAYDVRCEAIQVNAAATTCASQALEALRAWVEAKLVSQEQHCRAIRETCADLEQSLDTRLQSWFQRESELLELRLRAESVASDATDSNLESDASMSEERSLAQPTLPSAALSGDPDDLRAVRLNSEVRLRAARIRGERMHAASIRLHSQRRTLEREISEVDEALQHHARASNDHVEEGNSTDVAGISTPDPRGNVLQRRIRQAHEERQALQVQTIEREEQRVRGSRIRGQTRGGNAHQHEEQNEAEQEASEIDETATRAAFEEAMRREARIASAEAADREVRHPRSSRVRTQASNRLVGVSSITVGIRTPVTSEREAMGGRNVRRGRGGSRARPGTSGSVRGESQLALARAAAQELVQARADTRAASLRR